MKYSAGMKRSALALLLSAFLAVALAQQDLAPPPPPPLSDPAPPADPGAPELLPVPPSPQDAPPLVPVPALPPAAPPQPQQPKPKAAPTAPVPVLTLPAPVAPTPTVSAGQPQSAPPAPAPNLSVPPQPKTAPDAPAPEVVVPVVPLPLSLVLDVPLRGLQDGQPLVASRHFSLEIPAERAQGLREGGVVTAALETELRSFASKVASKPQDARFEQLASGWALIQRDGVALDLDKSRASLLRALNTPGTTRVALSFTTTAPARTLDFFTSRGIVGLLARGQTNYDGSSRARITNIHVGVSKFQDHLFSGKLFSFNKELGPIDTTTGFVPGLVIAGDRTATGVGGGICQVSSTVFRALYGAGLPIIERRNHSYQVHYYDPQGLDATIYQYSQDLKFSNDTGAALWFQVSWDDDQAELEVDVFGKPRPETVKIGRPVTLSTTPSPVNRLIPDATLRAGVRRQIDWAAPGAVIQVRRNFMKDGQVVRSDTLTSRYTPWPNIFLVGTKQ